MLLVSNNLQKYTTVDSRAVIRINMAWVKTQAELEKIIEENAFRTIFLDYPEGRAKPPKPVLPISLAYELCKKYPNIKYFAVSNVEDTDKVTQMQSMLPEHTEFVPKIETAVGVRNLTALIQTCGIKTLMLDKEDLYTDVGKVNEDFYNCVDVSRKICRVLNVNLLELEGVVFCTRE